MHGTGGLACIHVHAWASLKRDTDQSVETTPGGYGVSDQGFQAYAAHHWRCLRDGHATT